jgi:hypothetical protein
LRLFAVLFLAAFASWPQAARSAPATGVDEPPHRGAFVESSLGLFTVIGGSAPVSAAQPYLSFALGHELGEQGTVFLSLGIGGASASCFQVNRLDGTCAAADSFGMIFFEVGGSYGFIAQGRTRLSLKVVAGLTDLSPSPTQDAGSVPDSLLGFHVGAGLSLDYDTHLQHFAVGADVLVRYTIAPYTPASAQGTQTLGLVSLALMPRIRYVF